MSDDLSLDLFPEDPPPEQPPEPKVWSVSQVNRAVRGLLESSVEPLWVGGEVASWTRSRAGHCYFQLKDDRAQIRAVMFNREAQMLPADPEDGMQIRALGDLTLYEARGDYQLVVRRLQEEGADGLWRKAFEALKSKLEAEGLLATDRKRPLPRHPVSVGVVTSPAGAALRDIVSVVGRRAPWARIVLSGTKVQGEGASIEIAAALDRLSESGTVDVIIVGRGGGSVEDLWAFNEEPVARAIARSPVPVISAVGHETDVTISDLVADLRAPTPSAAAEAVVPEAEAIQATLRRTSGRLADALRRAGQRRRRGVEETLGRLIRLAEGRIRPARQRVDGLSRATERRLATLREDRARRLAGMAGKLDALSPLATLTRGYAVARSSDGEVLRRVDDFERGAAFRLRVLDGTVHADVTDTEPEALG